MKSAIILLIVSVSSLAFGQSKSEDFQGFVGRFFSDSTFQAVRIKYPLATLKYSHGFEQIDTSFTDAARWRFSNFGFWGAKGSDTYHVQIYDNFAQTLRDSAERVIAFEGLENGIHVSLFFRLLTGKWFLIKIEDFST